MDEEKWYLKITRTGNGYFLEGSEEDSIWVIQETPDPLKANEELLWDVMDYFGFAGSKHDAERIRVVRVKREEE